MIVKRLSIDKRRLNRQYFIARKIFQEIGFVKKGLPLAVIIQVIVQQCWFVLALNISPYIIWPNNCSH
jgi:hypothetical protein